MKRILTVFAICLLVSCASRGPVPARLYNLVDGSLVNIQLSNFRNGHGSATAELPHGEILKGEYTLGNVPVAPNYFRSLDIKVDTATLSSAVPGKDDPSWQEVYGYGKEAKAVPVGTGTLIGEKGTILHLVFFTADPWNEIGDGVARSSFGHWYRFHVGAMEK